MTAWDEAPESDNLIFLRGRLAAEPDVRTLPSGDEICVFRLTVSRPDGERARVDSIDCSSANSRVRRSVLAAAPGQVLEVRGQLHRRFWRANGSLASRYEVQVVTARVSRRRSAASPVLTPASA